MMKYIAIILAALLFSCDPMFNEWFDTETSMSDVKWRCIDGIVTSLNTSSGIHATDPAICINDGAVFTAWAEGASLVVKRFNGDAENPIWDNVTMDVNTSMGISTPANVSLISLNGSLFIGCRNGTLYSVARFTGSSWEAYGDAASNVAIASMTSFAGKIYLTYKDSAGNYIYALRCDGSYSWVAVNDIYGSGIGDTGNSSDAPAITATGSALFAAYIENTGYFRIKVRSFSGSSWTTVSSSFVYSSYADDNDLEPSASTTTESLFAAWPQQYNANTQRRISVFSYQNGMWSRIDGGMDNGIRYYDSYQSLGTVKTGTVNDKFYAVWLENNTGVATDDRLRGKIFNGDIKDAEWNSIDNNMPITCTNDQVISFNTIGYDSKIYIVFTEANAGINQVHVMVGN